MGAKTSNRSLTPAQADDLLAILKARFLQHMGRHKGMDWAAVQARLHANPAKLWSLHQMEQTGGEPDVVGHDLATGAFIFYDCSPQSPRGRRSYCYDRQALDARKE